MANTRFAKKSVPDRDSWKSETALEPAHKTAKVAALVRAIKKARNLTGKEISEQSGVTVSCLDKLLYNGRMTSVTLRKLSKWAANICKAPKQPESAA